MNLKYLDAVYNLNQSLTKPPEQAVLLALTFRKNQETLLCCPSVENLITMTHFSERTIKRALNRLRAKGYIDWDTGGFKSKRRRKDGQLLANEYKIAFKKIFEQAEQEKAKRENAKQNADGKDVNSDINRVVNSNATMCTSDTQQSVTAAPDSVHERHTAECHSGTPTEIITENKQPKDNRNESGSGLSTGNVFDAALSDMEIVPPPSKEERLTEQQRQAKEESTTEKLLRICGFEKGTDKYKANAISFTKMLLKIDAIYPGRAREIVYQFESEMRQGEMKGIRKLAAYLMSRLKDELPPSPPNP